METSHTPSFLKTAVKENNMILAKENRQMTALSGSAGFGSAKPDFECDVREADVLDGSSLQLRGDVQATGDYDGDCLFNGSAYSLIDQITIEYNGQPVLQLNSDADHIAHMNRVLHSSSTQFANDDVFALAGVNIMEKNSFVLDLAKYGSALKYFLVTAPVASLKVRIHFQTNLPRVFHGANSDGKSVTGYTINNLRLCGDFMNLESEAKAVLVKKLQSPSGMKMAVHSFIPQRNQLLAGATNHIIQGSYQYRNIVSTYYLPVPTSITGLMTNSGISTTDIIANVNYETALTSYPQKLLIRMNGSNYVNQNGTVGESDKMTHLTGVLKAAVRTPEENNIGSELCKQYKANTYQITGASFVRGNDNLVAITNSGVNGYFSRGVLETSFETATAPVNKTLLTIGVVTTVVSVENGQVSVLR